MSISIADLEFENGRLVKVRGMRPEYMSGGQLINVVRELAVLAAHRPVSCISTGAHMPTIMTLVSRYGASPSQEAYDAIYQKYLDDCAAAEGRGTGEDVP